MRQKYLNLFLFSAYNCDKTVLNKILFLINLSLFDYYFCYNIMIILCSVVLIL